MTRKQATYVVVAGMAGFAIALYLIVAIGPFAEPSVTRLGRLSGTLPGGRPGQGIARANALHAAHVSAAIQCGRCHRRADAGAAEHRCVSCHDDRATAVHAGVADPAARECLSCHDFLHLPKASMSVWGCPSCHVAPEPSDAPTRLGAGPQVAVHGDVFCGECHAPHENPPLRPRPCGDCHDQQATRHAAGAADGAARCLVCHRAHAPAGQRRPCADCHAREAASALFAGHDRCTNCHQPHGFTADTVAPCGNAGCHRDRVGATAAARKRHDQCTDCHRPHAPRSGLRARCTECHGDRATKHPASKQGACLGCHAVHSSAGAPAVVTVACSSCHRDTSSDRAFHNGARCSDCHRPHGQLIGDGSARFCLGCHAEKVGKAAAIRATASGHAQCRKCHVRAQHDTRRKPSSCAICHKKEGRAVIAGHRDCATCHETHSGAIRAGAQCKSCHTEAKRPDSHRASGYGKCTACHNPHDGRTRR